MARIFLSYARDDIDCARKLAELIGRAGHDVWWDHELHGGSRFTAEIDKALQDAEAVVVLWSNASLESAWVQDEAAEGRDSGRLVPATIDSVRPPLGFRQYQAIDLTDLRNGQQPRQLEELLRSIVKVGVPDERKANSEAAPIKKEAASKPSICVLPFANMSGEAEQEYFSDGISEDIITDLSKVSALSVVARNTAFTFKGQTVDVKQVAKTLGVSHVLEGSVRKAGNRVRITAQLIDGAAGDHVWADRYDRDLTDIFEIQDEISKAIVDALRLKLLPKEKTAIEARGTSSAEAYNLYLMARQQWIGGLTGSVHRDESIVRLCQSATTLDPEYAEAWALMALAQLELRFMHNLDVDALPAAERALEINPQLATAHCVKARYLEEEGKADEAENQVRTALKLDTESFEANREAARMLFRHGHIRESVPHFEKAASTMEMDFICPAMLITCYNSLGDAGKAQKAAKLTLERTERALAKDTNNCSALAMGASALTVFGENERARDWVGRALLLDPDNLTVRYNLACSLACELNDPEAAMEAIQPYLERTTSVTQIWHLEVDPDLDPIREDQRFKDMLADAKQRLGMTGQRTA